jgi:hypothetical protein
VTRLANGSSFGAPVAASTMKVAARINATGVASQTARGSRPSSAKGARSARSANEAAGEVVVLAQGVCRTASRPFGTRAGSWSPTAAPARRWRATRS